MLSLASEGRPVWRWRVPGLQFRLSGSPQASKTLIHQRNLWREVAGFRFEGWHDEDVVWKDVR